MNLLHTVAHLFHPRRSNNHRPRVLHPEALVYIAFIVVGIGFTVSKLHFLTLSLGNVLGYASNISSDQVVAATNSQRQQAGLSALTINGQLNQAALAKGNDMFANQYWAHTSPTGKEPWDFIRGAGYRFKRAGENLARDFDTTDTMMGAWMSSPTHRANIMNNQYQEIGVAVINGVLQGVETTLVVQMFGSPSGAAPAQVAPSTATTQAPPETQQQPPLALVQPTAAPAAPTTPIVVPSPTPTVEPSPSLSPELAVDLDSDTVESADTPVQTTQQVLARFLIPEGNIRPTIIFSPSELLKAFFLSVVLLLLFTWVYDFYIVGHKRAARLVGKNIAHVLLFLTVAFLLIFFKSGSIAQTGISF